MPEMTKPFIPDLKSQSLIDWQAIPKDQVSCYLDIIEKIGEQSLYYTLRTTVMRVLLICSVASGIFLVGGQVLGIPILIVAFANAALLALAGGLTQVYTHVKINRLALLISQHDELLKKFVSRYFIE